MYSIKLYMFYVLNTVLFAKYGDWIPLTKFIYFLLFFLYLDYYNILISMWLSNHPLLSK